MGKSGGLATGLGSLYGAHELVDPRHAQLSVAESQAVGGVDFSLHAAEASIDKLEAVADRFAPGDLDALRLPPPPRRSAVPGTTEKRIASLVKRMGGEHARYGLGDAEHAHAVQSMLLALASLTAIHSQVEGRIRRTR